MYTRKHLGVRLPVLTHSGHRLPSYPRPITGLPRLDSDDLTAGACRPVSGAAHRYTSRSLPMSWHVVTREVRRPGPSAP